MSEDRSFDLSTVLFHVTYRQYARKVGTSANSAIIRYYLPRLKLSIALLSRKRGNERLVVKKKSDDRHVQRTRQKHGRCSYLSVGIGGDSQSLVEQEPMRSKARGLLSYNIEITSQSGRSPYRNTKI